VLVNTDTWNCPFKTESNMKRNYVLMTGRLITLTTILLNDGIGRFLQSLKKVNIDV
jgi:hypothetical protein